MEEKPNDPEKTEVIEPDKDDGNGAEKAAPVKPAEPDPETRLRYVQAEFENTKKRIAREAENSIKFANERLIRDLLPIVNLFERALAAAAPLKNAEEKKADVQNFIVGIEMTHRELTLTLERFGVEWIGKKGEPFNPERHEAITQVEAAGAEPGSVVDVLERGCLLNGRLLHPAKVTVAKAKQGS